MANDIAAHESDDWPLSNPWPFLLAGVTCATVALLLAQIIPDVESWYPVRAALIVIGVLVAGGAVVIQPRSTVVLGVAAAVAFISYWGLNTDWDSARLLMGVLTGVALTAAFLYFPEFLDGILPDKELIVGVMLKITAAVAVLGLIGWFFAVKVEARTIVIAVVLTVSALLYGPLLVWPVLMRRVLFSLFVLFHFGGIVTSILSVPPPDRPGPWITQQLWTRVYRPYLEFMYLTNAYHFYSPNPGPPHLLWCCIYYDDNSTRWVKLPNRKEHSIDPLEQEYFRRLTLTELLNQPMGASPVVNNTMITMRKNAGTNHPGGRIPMHPFVGEAMQYRPAGVQATLLLPSYARRLCQAYPNEMNPKAKVKSVKIYLVVHHMLQPEMFLRDDIHPLSKGLFHPYYMGEFDPDGNLKDPYDPMLYWLIPIIPQFGTEVDAIHNQTIQFMLPPDLKDVKLKGYYDALKIHAGSDPWGEEQ
ncbi:MAG: hypothetical protein ACK4RK_20445 [Gemmataceae bacterium]